MTTPTGQISLANVNTELGYSSTAQISMNDAAVRTLAGVPSGAISMQNLQGKSNRVSLSYTYSANTANASLNVAGLSGYIAGKSDITITVNSGIYIYSTAVGTPGLTLTGGSTGDTVTLVNNGYIMGMGGKGGGGFNLAQVAAVAGGTALSLGFDTTVNNTNASAYIGGGGGGGGSKYFGCDGGGGAGGGAGGGVSGSDKAGTYNVAGGAGGSVGASGSNGSVAFASAGGGGRIFPGTGGAGGTGTTSNGYGRGGGSGGGGAAYSASAVAGAGGSANAAGGNATNASGRTASGGGGGWGASGGTGYSSGASQTGAAGGKAVALNGKTITWTSGNTTRVYGSVA